MARAEFGCCLITKNGAEARMKLRIRRKPFPFRPAHLPAVGLGLLSFAGGQAPAQGATAKSGIARTEAMVGLGLSALAEPAAPVLKPREREATTEQSALA